MVYKFKSGVRFSVSPQVAGETLEGIRETYGSLTARLVVEESRDKDAPLHGCFEWRDAVAAEKHREAQARHVIRSVTITFENESKLEREFRAFVHIGNQEPEESETYIPIQVAMASQTLRAKVVARALTELEAWKQRYRGYDELAQYFIAIEQAGLDLI